MVTSFKAEIVFRNVNFKCKSLLCYKSQSVFYLRLKKKKKDVLITEEK